MKQLATGIVRKTGIDFLRMLSMYMVVVLHVLGQGGVLSHTEWMSGQYITAWLLEVAAYCAVNCFGLISGYVGYESKYRWSKLIALWLQVMFFSLGITILFAVFMPGSASITVWLKSILPVTAGEYWYITAYVGMFLFIPLMNIAIDKMRKEQVALFIVAFSVLYLVIPSVTMRDPYSLKGGYSVIWLCLLYLIGGWIKKYKIDQRFKRRYAFLVFVTSTLLVLLSKIVLEVMTFKIWGAAKYGTMFISYTSPFILLNGVVLLCVFARTDFKTNIGKNVVHWLSPAALGVYLIHVHPLVWKYVIKGVSDGFAEYMPICLALSVLGLALAIYVVCSAFELLRLKLFALLKVQNRLKVIDERLNGIGF